MHRARLHLRLLSSVRRRRTSRVHIEGRPNPGQDQPGRLARTAALATDKQGGLRWEVSRWVVRCPETDRTHREEDSRKADIQGCYMGLLRLLQQVEGEDPELKQTPVGMCLTSPECGLGDACVFAAAYQV
mmetsp:Transcript_11117/g.26514  ORF Transcript_11117/g.26514 Transcript_11117/m.26514 type:complete len:130 (-) Transcript_11117:40-429(-)